MWCHFLPTIRSSSCYPCTEQKIVFPEADSDVKQFQRCSSCLYFASSFVTSSQVCSSNPNPDVFGQNTCVFTRAVTGWWVSNKHVRKEQTCVSGLDEITKLPRHVIPWSYFNLCFLLSSSSSVCFFVLPVRFFLFYTLQKKDFSKRDCAFGDAAMGLLLLWQAEEARSRREDRGMRRVSDGRTSRRLRTTVSAHHVVFPSFFPPLSSVCLSPTFWLHSVPRVSFFLSLSSFCCCFSPLPLPTTFPALSHLHSPLSVSTAVSASSALLHLFCRAVGGSNWVAMSICFCQWV